MCMCKFPCRTYKRVSLLISSHPSLNSEGRWGTTDDFATSFLHFSLFSTALLDLANSRPVPSLMLFFPPLPLSDLSSSPFHLALQDGFSQTWWTGDMTVPLSVYVSLWWSGGLPVVRLPIVCWIFARTFSLATWSLYEMCSILRLSVGSLILWGTDLVDVCNNKERLINLFRSV